ncbi:MAG TPA: hypothetical protein VLK58_01185, partial [Conexibacter sp.]|nr:hypothetical protein [Conexibacter sp.]
SDPFQQLDTHLLRLTLERAFEGVRGVGVSGNRDFEAAVARTLRINLGIRQDSQLGSFLLRERDPATPPLFVAAANTASYLDPDYHANAISRAALLLRVATGASSRMFSRAEVFPEDFRFWTTSFAESHGICDKDQMPDDPLDLWADVDDAINDLEITLDQRVDHSFFKLLNGAASPLAVLTGCERMALWGLAA